MVKSIYILLFYLLFCGCSEAKINEGGGGDIHFNRDTALATFAGGCSRYIEAPFEGIEGVISVQLGYAGGKEKNPSHDDVSSGNTGHKEVVQITYSPEVISFSELMDIFWQQFDPTDEGGSFQDRGSQYTSAVFYHSSQQKAVAEASKKLLDKSGKFDRPIATNIVKYTNFYPAEEKHQDYYRKNPEEFRSYRKVSGRDQFIADHWEIPEAKKYPMPSESAIKSRLTDLQYRVTIEQATEQAFNNAFDRNKNPGIYVCIISGAPLFSSTEKFDSKTGWPSFTKPIDARFLTKKIDTDHGMTRVEVRSKFGNAHGGHVFNDGPSPTNLRYCMNSASFKFISTEDMIKEGYGGYLWLFN